MKKILSVFVILILCFTLAASVFSSDLPRLVDDGGLLTASENAELLAKLDEISTRQQFDVVVVTIPTLDGANITEYADDFYDYHGYGFGENYDGVLLLVAVEDRECWMTTTGYGITAFNDNDIEYILDEFAEEYTDDNYVAAFDVFAQYCDDYVTIARESEEFDPVFTAVIAIVVGFVIAFIATAVMKGQLKSVRYQSEASDYTKHGSLNVVESRDLFLYRTVSRREKPKNDSSSTSTHTSSSGRSHGGGGRSL